jgi:hypothetical protein
MFLRTDLQNVQWLVERGHRETRIGHAKVVFRVSQRLRHYGSAQLV